MPNSTDTLILSNLAEQESMFWLCIVIGILAGALAYAYATNENFRLSGWERFRELSPFAGILIGLSVIALVTLWKYHSSWGVFHRIKIDGNRVELSYYYPERTVTLSPSELREVTSDYSRSKTNHDHYLRLVTQDGTRYYSVRLPLSANNELIRILGLWKNGRDFSKALSEFRIPGLQ